MSEFTLQEITRQSIIVSKAVESTLSWNNSRLTVLTEKGIDIFDFSYNLSSYRKDIDLVASSIPCPKTTPATALFPDNFIKNELSNQNYIRCLLDPTLWPHERNYVRDLSSTQMYEWSQPDFMYNNQPVIAVLTNIGTIEIFVKSRLNYKSILNLSNIIAKELEYDGVVLNTLEMLSDACGRIESSSMCWGSKVTNTSFHFVCSQRNGDILIWTLDSQTCDHINVHLKGKIQSENGEIIKMLWIPKSNDNFTLVCSYLDGQIYAYNCKINHDEINMIEASCLWKYCDKMPAKYLEYYSTADKIILLCCKHRHLLLLLLDKDNTVLDHCIKNINDNKITGLSHTNIGFVVSTVNCVLFKINFQAAGDELKHVTFNPISMKESYSDYMLRGFSVSQNGVLWTLNLWSNKISYRVLPMKIEIAFLIVSEKNEIDLLLNNPSQKLTNMWDCIELLRYKACKFKILPKIDYSKLLLECNTSIYKLKIYLILLILYRRIIECSSSNHKWDYGLPEISVEKIKDSIFMKHALQLLHNIGKLLEENSALSEHQIEVYFGCKNNLQYYCEKYKMNISDFLKEFDLDTNIDYVCQCCDENLIGFTCKNNHLNQFCSLTFTQMVNDKYLTCKGCGSMARPELYSEKPTCIFCDIYLDDCHLP